MSQPLSAVCPVGSAPGPTETLWIAFDGMHDRVDEIALGVLKSRPQTDVLGYFPEMAPAVSLAALQKPGPQFCSAGQRSAGIDRR